MISFTSSSEVAEVAWRHWLRVFVGVTIAGLAAAYLLLLLIDPYDSGRFPSFGISGVTDENPRTADVSRGRNSDFNAAIIGNSTGDLLDAGRLSLATNVSFAHLTVPGTTAREQLTLLRWFLDHHQHIGALVVVTDEFWCVSDPDWPLEHPFPFWLYGSNLEYLKNVFRPHSFDLALRRIKHAFGLLAATDAAGHVGDESGRVLDPSKQPPPPDLMRYVAAPNFPWIARLNAEIGRIPSDVPVVLVVPPSFAGYIPPTGSESAVELVSCKKELQHLVTNRPRGGFLDYRFDDTMTRNPKNFQDYYHYHSNIARLIEADIAATINASKSAGQQLGGTH